MGLVSTVRSPRKSKEAMGTATPSGGSKPTSPGSSKPSSPVSYAQPYTAEQHAQATARQRQRRFSNEFMGERQERQRRGSMPTLPSDLKTANAAATP